MIQPIIDDNGNSEWMPCPKNDVNYPGLAYLCPLDELIVAQKTDAYHSLIGTKDNDYIIFNNQGQKVFLATQKGRIKFEIKIFNHYGNEIIRVKRSSHWCLNKILIWAPPGSLAGTVQETTACLKTYVVKNNCGDNILKVKAKGLFHLDFEVYLNNEVVGLLTGRWRLANCVVSFPIEMDIKLKCILLGACFLLLIGKRCVS